MEDEETALRKEKLENSKAKAAPQQSPCKDIKAMVESYLEKTPDASKITQVTDRGVIVKKIGETGDEVIGFNEPGFSERFNSSIRKRLSTPKIPTQMPQKSTIDHKPDKRKTFNITSLKFGQLL